MKRFLLFLSTFFFVQISLAGEIHSVLAHPLFKGFYSCTEHWAGQLPELGDALGSDCVVEKLTTEGGRTWLRAFKSNGHKNADWYGWMQEVLSPCTCEVVKININPVINEPGIMGKGVASFILLKSNDGVMFMLAHIANPQVHVGESVKQGQVLAVVGNNGQARLPHIHIGAWLDKEPLQLQFDQKHMGEADEQ